LAGFAVGAATLQMMGPPGGGAAGVAGGHTTQQAGMLPRVGMVAQPERTASGPIAAPDSALLEPAPGGAPGAASGAWLPRVAADGRAPMQVYAAGFDPATKAPRIGILIADVGLDEDASEDAIRALPALVTLAVSPYAGAPDAVTAAARRAGHEYLISLPLEPQGYALNDPGQRALLTSLSPADNARRLDWVLSRMTGYVGATGALGDMRGERFADVPDQMDPMLATLAARGLLYVDPRDGMARLPHVWSRAVDVVIDDPPSAASVDARLAELEKHAHDTGVALGLIGTIRPVTMEHLIAWVGNLAGRGFALAPVSALVTSPEGVTIGAATTGGATPGGTTPVGAATGSTATWASTAGTMTGGVTTGGAAAAGTTTGGTTTGGATTGGATAAGVTPGAAAAGMAGPGGATAEGKPPGGVAPK
jgi:uncharacterized protein